MRNGLVGRTMANTSSSRSAIAVSTHSISEEVAVAWLANTLHGFGVTIEPGHVVLSGSFVRAVRIGAGDTITAVFDQLGDVGITLR